jgi:4-hydroxybenzoate polyprenyltransferase
MFVGGWLRLARWRDWFQSKLPFITAAALLLAPSATHPLTILQMMGTVALWAAFGYGVNDIADRHVDGRAEKLNRAALISRASWILFLLLTATSALATCLLWAADAAAPGFLVLGLGAALAYSVPPIRLKERGMWGLLGAAVAQWSLPVVAMSAVEPWGWLRPGAWSLGVLGLGIGIRWMGVHQLQDAAADRRAAVRTYASRGRPQVERVIVGAFVSELLALALALLVTWPMSQPALIALAFWSVCRVLLRCQTGSFRTRLQGYGNAPLSEYYFLMLPVALALSRTSVWNGFFGIAALLLFTGAPHIYRRLREWRPGTLLSGTRLSARCTSANLLDRT